MKNERLFDAIGQIDEELIEEADPKKKQEQKKKIRVKGWMKISALAACACIVIFIALPDGNKSDAAVGDLEANQSSKPTIEEGAPKVENVESEDEKNYGENTNSNLKETITINNITEPLEIMLPMLSEEIRTEMIDEELFEYYGLNISETLTSIGDFEEEEGGYPKGIYNYSNGDCFDMNQFVYHERLLDYTLCISIGRNTNCIALIEKLDTEAQSSKINNIDMLILRTENEELMYAVFSFGDCDYIISGTNVEEDVFKKILGTITN